MSFVNQPTIIFKLFHQKNAIIKKRGCPPPHIGQQDLIPIGNRVQGNLISNFSSSSLCMYYSLMMHISLEKCINSVPFRTFDIGKIQRETCKIKIFCIRFNLNSILHYLGQIMHFHWFLSQIELRRNTIFSSFHK